MSSLFSKRKHEDDHLPRTKQVKVDSISDDDCAMNDIQHIMNAVPFPSVQSNGPQTPSPNYTLSALPGTPCSADSPNYPAFDLYPEPVNQFGMEVDQPTRTPHTSTDSTSSARLLQPSFSTALHHGDHCQQIPRLRLSSYPGLDGKRSLWSHCESCGAIEMVSN